MSSGHNALPASILAMQSLPQEGKYFTLSFTFIAFTLFA
jgi:hypothetical protein